MTRSLLLASAAALALTALSPVPPAQAHHGGETVQNCLYVATPLGGLTPKLCVRATALAHWTVPDDCSGEPFGAGEKCYHFHDGGVGWIENMVPGSKGELEIDGHDETRTCEIVAPAFPAYTGSCSLPLHVHNHAAHWSDPNFPGPCTSTMGKVTYEGLGVVIAGPATDRCT